jgi:hypothetical protein
MAPMFSTTSQHFVQITVRRERRGRHVVSSWRDNVHVVLSGYELCDVFNCDETGFFWRAVPNRTLAAKGDACRGGKLAKERITVLLCCSALGEKLPSFVIGKSRMPRAFRNKLPTKCTWKANKRAWMDSFLMEEFLCNLNAAMKAQNRKIILLLDNAPVHPPLELSHVKLLYLPANTTSNTQPLDEGIIKNFKYHYRGKVVLYLVVLVDQSLSPKDTLSTAD